MGEKGRCTQPRIPRNCGGATQPLINDHTLILEFLNGRKDNLWSLIRWAICGSWHCVDILMAYMAIFLPPLTFTIPSLLFYALKSSLFFSLRSYYILSKNKLFYFNYLFITFDFLKFVCTISKFWCSYYVSIK